MDEENFSVSDLKSENIKDILPMMKDFYELDNYPFDEKSAWRNFQKFIENPDFGKAFLISENQQIAGYFILVNFFSFEFGGNIWFLDELYIDSKFQGKSLGKKTVDFVKNLAKENKISVVFLEVENHNERAIKLYEKSGFAKHKRSLMILRNDADFD